MTGGVVSVNGGVLMIVRLKACLNGDRERSEHPAVPLTPAELATDAVAAIAAGADAVHLHPRSADGAESLVADDIGAAVGAVRQACPGVPIGVSTGLWISGGDVCRRLEWVKEWASLSPAARPDFASVNLSEPGPAELAGTLLEAGIGVEAGVWSLADAERLAGSAELRDVPWTRVLVELPDGATTAEADRILAALPGGVPALLHGEQASCWPLLRHAGARNLATRIGLEDTLTGPGNDPVPDNATLVALAVAELASAGS